MGCTDCNFPVSISDIIIPANMKRKEIRLYPEAIFFDPGLNHVL